MTGGHNIEHNTVCLGLFPASQVSGEFSVLKSQDLGEETNMSGWITRGWGGVWEKQTGSQACWAPMGVFTSSLARNQVTRFAG